MIYKPATEVLRKHIDHYWMITHQQDVFFGQNNMYAYPGITPDMLIVLDGFYTFEYLGKKYKSNQSLLFGFIYDKVFLDVTHLKSFIVVKFKSRGLASVLPFLNIASKELMKKPVVSIYEVFKNVPAGFEAYLKELTTGEIVSHLDDFFTKTFQKEKEGFMVDMAMEIGTDYNLKQIMEVTNYSYATLERYFKKETGIPPKRYQSLKRFKLTIQELYITQNTDWMHYVEKFGFYDQSHFIKELKKYTSLTPAQLLNIPSMSSYRPVEL